MFTPFQQALRQRRRSVPGRVDQVTGFHRLPGESPEGVQARHDSFRDVELAITGQLDACWDSMCAVWHRIADILTCPPIHPLFPACVFVSTNSGIQDHEHVAGLCRAALRERVPAECTVVTVPTHCRSSSDATEFLAAQLLNVSVKDFSIVMEHFRKDPDARFVVVFASAPALPPLDMSRFLTLLLDLPNVSVVVFAPFALSLPDAWKCVPVHNMSLPSARSRFELLLGTFFGGALSPICLSSDLLTMLELDFSVHNSVTISAQTLVRFLLTFYANEPLSALFTVTATPPAARHIAMLLQRIEIRDLLLRLHSVGETIEALPPDAAAAVVRGGPAIVAFCSRALAKAYQYRKDFSSTASALAADMSPPDLFAAVRSLVVGEAPDEHLERFARRPPLHELLLWYGPAPHAGGQRCHGRELLAPATLSDPQAPTEFLKYFETATKIISLADWFDASGEVDIQTFLRMVADMHYCGLIAIKRNHTAEKLVS